MRFSFLLLSFFLWGHFGWCIKAAYLDSTSLAWFFKATNGKNWVKPWDMGKPVSQWHGIELDDEGRIICIELADNNLQGKIPKNLFYLRKLRTINLSGNKLQGGIPSTVNNCRALKILNLSGNRLSGEIPQDLFKLSRLESLQLSNNYFFGELSGEIVKLKRLKLLELSLNNFSGEIPKAIGNLKYLVKINLSWNKFFGEIPPEIGLLLNLEYLNLENNNFENTPPISLRNLHNLKCLFFNDNKELFGILPLAYSTLKNLMIFNYRNTKLVAPRNSEYFFWLHSLIGYYPSDLKRNNKTYRMIDSLSLITLYKKAGGNKWKHQWDFNQPMTHWGRVLFDEDNERVVSLFLQNNGLDGEIPNELGNLTQLNELFLGSNNLKGVIPEDLIRLKKLKNLVLERNDFEGLVPTFLGELKQLVQLDLSENSFKGILPPALGLIDSLSKLDLKNNKLTGTISSQIWPLKKLTELNVSNNNLEEDLTYVFKAISVAVKQLNLSGNRFTGTLDSVVKLIHLDVLNVSSNRVGGRIPRHIYFLNDLMTLNLSGNFLKGTLPKEVGYLNNLINLQVDNNEALKGEMPRELVRLKQIKVLTYQNTSICLHDNLELISWMQHIPNTRKSNTSCLDSNSENPEASTTRFSWPWWLIFRGLN